MAALAQDNIKHSEKNKYQALLIENLKNEIELARKLDPEKIAVEIRKIGFSCQQCGKCCRQVFGDNRVYLIPSEIPRLQEFKGLPKLEIVEPFILEKPEEPVPEKSEVENNEKKNAGNFLKNACSEGDIHAFGWVLKRKNNGDCIFLQENKKRCSAYSMRPMLCATYPFYIEDLSLQICECEGLKKPISAEESLELAKLLLFRYITELGDMLLVYEKYMEFEKEKKDSEIRKEELDKNKCTYIVHDSTGSTEIRY